MKDIVSIYNESLLDDDEKFINDTVRKSLDIKEAKTLILSCLPADQRDVRLESYININDDGTITVNSWWYEVRTYGFTLIKDLPDIIVFREFPKGSSNKPIDITLEGPDITSLRGLPPVLDGYRVTIKDCPNFKGSKNVKSCTALYIVSEKDDISTKKIKYLPRPTGFLRTVNCTDADINYLSKISNTPKSKITCL